MDYPLGKKPASPLNKKAIMFHEVFDTSKMPTPPQVFGQLERMKLWYVYGNDEYGDCVWAAKAHMHMFWPLIGGYKRNYFWTNNVLSDYAAATGFRASDPDTDQGTDMKTAAEYHRKTGVRDASGNRHRVNAYVNLISGNVDQLTMATYVFGAVELGVLITEDNMRQFDKGEPWDITNDQPMGGHCIPVFGRDADGNFLCVSWGKVQRITPAFIEKYMDEAIAYLDPQILNKAGLSPGAYDKATLVKMLAQVSPQPVIKTLEQMATAESADNVEAIRYGFAGTTVAFPTDEQLEISFKVLRELLDKSGYGWAMSDEKLRPYSNEIAIKVVAATKPTEEKTP